MKSQTYQRAVRFTCNGVSGHCDKRNWVLFGNCGFHLDDIATDSAVRRAIHKVRNNEWTEPSKPQN